MSILDKAHTMAPKGYNRWLIPPAALAVHLSIGQVYALSVFKGPLENRLDISHTESGIIFSIAIVMLGLSAAFGGRWMERNGPRKAMVLAAACWSAGFAVGALGIYMENLWIVYLGYGFIGGIGLGIGYISPVSTLIKWFPDRPGLATGLAIMGFGGGAMLASPLSVRLMDFYADTDAEALVPTWLTMGGIYLVMMLLGAAVIRVPEPGWKPEGWVPKEHGPKLSSGGQVNAKSAIKTPAFYALWVVLFCNVTAGIGILENASPMIQDYFPEVSKGAAGGFVGLLSLANMLGRIGWSSLSDFIGRKWTYVKYLGVGAILFSLVAFVGDANIVSFVILAVTIITFYGGGFATIPAYLKDVFGEFEVGAIHGRLLTAWSAAGIAGPLIINSILDSRENAGIEGADKYTLGLLVMVGLLIIGFVANLLVRPVDAKHHVAHDELPDHHKPVAKKAAAKKPAAKKAPAKKAPAKKATAKKGAK